MSETASDDAQLPWWFRVKGQAPSVVLLSSGNQSSESPSSLAICYRSTHYLFTLLRLGATFYGGVGGLTFTLTMSESTRPRTPELPAELFVGIFEFLDVRALLACHLVTLR